ncbi:hypothetical protein BDZ91DRAFT_729817 [Kalaharituber pfeilii]|nr:hypothetical protein BDZ91DRAFT_729817 [Kalaharituber pfeilii]
MADGSGNAHLSSQAAPVSNVLYELENNAARPPIPAKEPVLETNVRELDSAPTPRNPTSYGAEEQVYPRYPSSYPGTNAPQAPSVAPSSPQSAHPSMGFNHTPISPSTNAPPQQAPNGQQMSSTQDHWHQNHQKYGSVDYNNRGTTPTPQYNAPIAGYYSPVQYDPNQSYIHSAGPLPTSAAPKPEYSYYSGQPQPPQPGQSVVAGAPASAAGQVTVAAGGESGEKSAKKRICGFSVTMFSLICIILFLIVAGAILGGVLGGVVFKGDGDSEPQTSSSIYLPAPTSSPPITTDPPTTIVETISPSTTTTSTTTYTPFPLPTGTWTLDGDLKRTIGRCISNPAGTYREVWYCNETSSMIVQIEDWGTSKDLLYVLNIDSPVRARGIIGSPPTGNLTAGDVFWGFNVPYERPAVHTTGECQVDISLTVFLGERKSSYLWVDEVYSPKGCPLPGGATSDSRITCTCIYIGI